MEPTLPSIDNLPNEDKRTLMDIYEASAYNVRPLLELLTLGYKLGRARGREEVIIAAQEIFSAPPASS